ncbi:PaREP1 family protein [Saccharolobus islandicus]|uniref:PaREP1 family protein n=2 Tax=Saccharolobus islandicus TaxID=43080 RepID=C3MX41_SACI4|nr:PaREP1 family protein [Sulfolobus islandicus]ACP37721.1 PaREP1 family protein [Sulfolobus islandicus M.14.25]ACP54917.1 PaREP1 family protein [Sulfolobus islandicus M.16.27]
MEELIKKAEEKGIDVEDLVLSALSRIDPKESIKLRIELAEKYMVEAEEYIRKGDPVQASEKVYKVAEEVVKALSEKFNLPEYQQAVKEGRWYTYTLGKASNTLSNKLGNWVLDGWSSAYFLHVWGFHEAKLSINDITSYLKRVKEMLEEAKKVLSNEP